MVNWPTKENSTQWYSFNSLWIEYSQEYHKIERATYSVLEWFGDVGGLYDGLLIITSAIFGSIASLSLKIKTLSLAFSQRNDFKNH